MLNLNPITFFFGRPLAHDTSEPNLIIFEDENEAKEYFKNLEGKQVTAYLFED